tara:strand:+ start:106 stop:786 length:681 start_codon:yes stop_codon:yes gene_type:complete
MQAHKLVQHRQLKRQQKLLSLARKLLKLMLQLALQTLQDHNQQQAHRHLLLQIVRQLLAYLRELLQLRHLLHRAKLQTHLNLRQLLRRLAQMLKLLSLMLRQLKLMPHRVRQTRVVALQLQECPQLKQLILLLLQEYQQVQLQAARVLPLLKQQSLVNPLHLLLKLKTQLKQHKARLNPLRQTPLQVKATQAAVRQLQVVPQLTLPVQLIQRGSLLPLLLTLRVQL